MDKYPDIDKAVIVIVNWNGLHFLKECLSSVEQQTYRYYETILVDNGSTDGSIAYVKSHYPTVRIIALDRNEGFAKANNLAMEEALRQKINYIALLNNDTKADRRWLEHLMQVVKKDAKNGICASKMLLMSDPTVLDSTGHIFQSGKISDRGHGEVDSGQYDDKPDVIGACAGACLYRREMLEAIGLFDESFVTYCEDAELSWRAHNSGWKARFVPESVVLHYHGGTTRSTQEIDRAMVELSTINMVKMIRRHDSFVGKLRTSFAWFRMALRGSLEQSTPWARRRWQALFRPAEKVVAVTGVAKPQVSVVLPYYEGEKWLRRSVESVLSQRDVTGELIVVDDGSSQSPVPVSESIQNDRLRLIRIDHAGKGAALNRGVAEASAELVCFIDQDDIMNPGRLKLQYQAFADHPHADVVYSDYERVSHDGRVIDRFVSRQATGGECLKSMARSISLVSMQTLMMKRVLFTDICGFSNDLRLTGLDDAEFFVRLFSSGAALQYVPGIVQKWVFHGQNYSESADFQQTRLVFLEYLERHAAANPLIRAELRYFRYHAYYMRGIFYLEKGLARRALQEYLKAVKLRPLHGSGYYLLLKSWVRIMKAPPASP